MAGRRDRQTGQAPPGVIDSVRDHSEEEEAAKCVVSKTPQSTFQDPVFTGESFQRARLASVTLGRVFSACFVALYTENPLRS